MLLTEDEAHNKLCLLSFNSVGINRELKCLASGCMAWRFGAPLLEIVAANPSDLSTDKPVWQTGESGWKLVPFHDHTKGAQSQRWQRIQAERGFCGLAGATLFRHRDASPNNR